MCGPAGKRVGSAIALPFSSRRYRSANLGFQVPVVGGNVQGLYGGVPTERAGFGFGDPRLSFGVSRGRSISTTRFVRPSAAVFTRPSVATSIPSPLPTSFPHAIAAGFPDAGPAGGC
jgi:hypothetical protein